MKIKTILTTAILLLITSACVSTSGNPEISNKSLLNKIQKEKTTKNDILNWFGKPGGKRFDDNSEGWDYAYSYSKVTPLIFIGAFLPGSSIGIKVKHSSLSVIFSSDTDRVINYGHNVSE